MILLFIKKFLLVFIPVFLLIIIILFIKIGPKIKDYKETAYNKLSNISINTFINLSDTIIYDKDGNILDEINIGNYEYATFDKVSKWVTEGYIVVEDKNFKTHHGIDYKSLLRASIALVKNKGKVTQGGSTITQQVIKNNLLSQERTFERKIIELFIAPEFEKLYTKQQIMEFYVNTNFYANNCYGIETASKYYFGKSAKDLSIAESALFVGLSNNPSKYNPVTNPEASIKNRDAILQIMKNNGLISEVQYAEAINTPLFLILEKESRNIENYQVSYAIHCTALKLMELNNFNFQYIFDNESDLKSYTNEFTKAYTDYSNKIRQGGYKIYTSLDNSKQKILQTSVDKTLSKFTEKEEDGRYSMQGASVAIDNKTGYIVAIVGGRGTEDQFNRGFLAKRQPGSTIKPIVAYGPAFDTGKYYPSLKVNDKKIIDGPENATKSYRGKVTIREALARSINTIPYNILQDIKPDTGMKYLSNLKFSSLSNVDNNNGSLALGGFTYGVRVVDMAKAYYTFVNEGKYSDATCIKKIEYQSEGEIYRGQIKETEVYTKDTAYLILDCLKDTIEKFYGTAHGSKLKNAIAGAKTGTTNDNKDGWFCGVTDYYTVVAWCGYDNPRPVLGMGGGTYPGQIWKTFMDEVHKSLPLKDFKKPDTIIECVINRNGEYTDKKYGTKDIFSKIAIDKIKQEKEKAHQELLKKKEVENENKVKIIVKNFTSLIIDSPESYYAMLDEYDNSFSQVSKLKNSELLSQLTEELNKSKIKFENDKLLIYNDIEEYNKNLRIQEDERKAREYELNLLREKEEREKEERNRILKQNNIIEAENAILSLSKISIVSVDENITEIVRPVLIKIERCANYSNYNQLLNMFNIEKERLFMELEQRKDFEIETDLMQ